MATGTQGQKVVIRTHDTSSNEFVDQPLMATESTQMLVLEAVGSISGTTPYNFIVSAEDSTHKYYGFASASGWRFKRKELSTGIWKVASGTGSFDTNWADKEAKSYNYV